MVEEAAARRKRRVRRLGRVGGLARDDEREEAAGVRAVALADDDAEAAELVVGVGDLARLRLQAHALARQDLDRRARLVSRSISSPAHTPPEPSEVVRRRAARPAGLAHDHTPSRAASARSRSRAGAHNPAT